MDHLNVCLFADLTRQILVSAKNSIRRISLDTDDFSDVHLPVLNIENSVAIDYDFANQKLFYSDQALNQIRSFGFNGSDVQIVIEKENPTPSGLAFDWVAKNLYWSDASRNIIEVARSDGMSRKVIIDLDLDEPRALALWPALGFLFWIDSGAMPKLERGLQISQLHEFNYFS